MVICIFHALKVDLDFFVGWTKVKNWCVHRRAQYILNMVCVCVCWCCLVQCVIKSAMNGFVCFSVVLQLVQFFNNKLNKNELNESAFHLNHFEKPRLYFHSRHQLNVGVVSLCVGRYMFDD